jgi:hypothetical protein
MEVLVVIFSLVGLVALAARFGYDSRETYRSKEEELAVWGMRWERDAQQHLQRPRRPSTRARWVRVQLADAVVRLANWLDPPAIASAS